VLSVLAGGAAPAAAPERGGGGARAWAVLCACVPSTLALLI
jgi:hypothetical protein